MSTTQNDASIRGKYAFGKSARRASSPLDRRRDRLPLPMLPAPALPRRPGASRHFQALVSPVKQQSSDANASVAGTKSWQHFQKNVQPLSPVALTRPLPLVHFEGESPLRLLTVCHARGRECGRRGGSGYPLPPASAFPFQNIGSWHAHRPVPEALPLAYPNTSAYRGPGLMASVLRKDPPLLLDPCVRDHGHPYLSACLEPFDLPLASLALHVTSKAIRLSAWPDRDCVQRICLAKNEEANNDESKIEPPESATSGTRPLSRTELGRHMALYAPLVASGNCQIHHTRESPQFGQRAFSTGAQPLCIDHAAAALAETFIT
ncbi:hypothetical protein B0J12DRAFT_726755 [Macrophomina phaseolina]|uniref:Uncharacterized protein n=1 Tax=Macrophomina phaseolina TaxID=35725 RepID=A0ABQ8GH60_9PEZI|nr:hypothetical protein B0J12DRAFT_726755 [Macrophomina phaseolina]